MTAPEDQAAGAATALPAVGAEGPAAPTAPREPDLGPEGTIHDLGYKRYLGTRLPQSSRWRVIMRQQLGFAWKTWWRFKIPMLGALIATVVGGAVMYVWSDTVMGMLGRRGGGGPEALGVRFLDGIVPLSVLWYCKIGFIASLTVAATVVATDVRTGALTFYFARPVRPLDYVLGKAAGLVVLSAILVAAGPVLLTLFQLGLSGSTALIVDKLPNVAYAALVGVLGTLVYSVVPLGFSAMVADRRWAMGLWAMYYVAFGSIMTALGNAVWQPLAALDLPTALTRISFSLFDLTFVHSVPFDFKWGVASVVLHAAVALTLVFWRVGQAAREGVGGMS